MSEFSVNGHTYRADKLPALRAFDLARKWAPVLINLAMASKADPVPSDENIVKAMVAMAAGISQADSDAVIAACLAVVSRREGDHWQRLSPGGGQLQYQNMELPELMQVVLNVVRENGLISFFNVPADAASAGATTPQ